MMEPIPSRRLRILLILLGVPNLVAGLWAVVAPRSWFDDFPGWAPRLVAAHPPYNDHLATDAGAGLLTIGILALVAAWKPRRHVIVTASLGCVVFSTPHLLFHVFESGDGLGNTDRVAELGPLVLAVVVSLYVLVDSLTHPEVP